MTDKTTDQSWSLDPTGNWKQFREDDTGDGTWDLEQTRTANPVNEITGISATVGPTWVAPAYNRAGNMTTMPKVAGPTVSQTCTYDAWNRLVKVVIFGVRVSRTVKRYSSLAVTIVLMTHAPRRGVSAN